MCPSAMTIRVKPARASWASTTSRIGVSPTGSSGFGVCSVSGRSRVPSPPASTTAQGMPVIVKKAMAKVGKQIPLRVVTISTRGELLGQVH